MAALLEGHKAETEQLKTLIHEHEIRNAALEDQLTAATARAKKSAEEHKKQSKSNEDYILRKESELSELLDYITRFVGVVFASAELTRGASGKLSEKVSTTSGSAVLTPSQTQEKLLEAVKEGSNDVWPYMRHVGRLLRSKYGAYSVAADLRPTPAAESWRENIDQRPQHVSDQPGGRKSLEGSALSPRAPPRQPAISALRKIYEQTSPPSPAGQPWPASSGAKSEDSVPDELPHPTRRLQRESSQEEGTTARSIQTQQQQLLEEILRKLNGGRYQQTAAAMQDLVEESGRKLRDELWSKYDELEQQVSRLSRDVARTRVEQREDSRHTRAEILGRLERRRDEERAQAVRDRQLLIDFVDAKASEMLAICRRTS